MHTEIECRLLNCDVERFLEKLKETDAKFVGDWLQLRYCYDFNPVKPNSWVRLRTNGKETTITIKEIQDKSIHGTKESEIVVSDFYVADEILNKLGYYARSKQENRRVQFKLDGVEIDIDFWPNIPTYVEFEAPTDEALEGVLAKLGIDLKNLTTMDVSSIYEYYGYNISKSPILTLEEERKTLFKEEIENTIN